LLNQIVYSVGSGNLLPLGQLIDGVGVIGQNTLIERRNRIPTNDVQTNVIDGLTPPNVFADVRPHIEAIELQLGYTMEWGGGFESAGVGRQSLGRQMPLSFGTMLVITVLLLGKLRQTAAIWTVVPMAINAVARGLLFSGLAFSLTGLLG